MAAPELKPCPFCGRAMEITDDLRHYNHPVSACFGRHISIAASDIDRIEMWSRRDDLAAVQPMQVQPDPRDEVIARLVGALRLMRSTYPYNPPCYGWEEQVEAHKTAKAALAAVKGDKQ